MGIGPKWSCGNAPLADKKYKIGFSDDHNARADEVSYDYGVNPNPHNFKIRWAAVVNGHTIMRVNYPDCTTFGGDKLLLLRGIHIPREIKNLDPHFFEGNHPVIARFEPTEEGNVLAHTCALAL